MTITSKDISWALKNFLSEKRKKLNLSVRELGKRAGVSYTVIYDFEERGILPKIETLLKMADALKVDINSVDYSTGNFIISVGNCEKFSYEESSNEESSPMLEIDKLLNRLELNSQKRKEILSFVKFKMSED